MKWYRIKQEARAALRTGKRRLLCSLQVSHSKAKLVDLGFWLWLCWEKYKNHVFKLSKVKAEIFLILISSHLERKYEGNASRQEGKHTVNLLIWKT